MFLGSVTFSTTSTWLLPVDFTLACPKKIEFFKLWCSTLICISISIIDRPWLCFSVIDRRQLKLYREPQNAHLGVVKHSQCTNPGIFNYWINTGAGHAR